MTDIISTTRLCSNFEHYMYTPQQNNITLYRINCRRYYQMLSVTQKLNNCSTSNINKLKKHLTTRIHYTKRTFR